jgi:hypothetical protein
MCQIVKNEADRQFRRKCQIVTGLSLVVFVMCSQGSLRMHRGPLDLAVAGVAGAAFFAELVSVGLLLGRLRDEFQRTLLLRSFLWATVITMAVATIWGFIELRAHGMAPHVGVIWVPVLLVCLTAAAKLLIFRQYRPASE